MGLCEEELLILLKLLKGKLVTKGDIDQTGEAVAHVNVSKRGRFDRKQDDYFRLHSTKERKTAADCEQQKNWNLETQNIVHSLKIHK